MKQTIYYFFFIIVFATSGCKLEDPSEGINIDDVITLEVQKETLLADGVDNMVVKAKLGPQSDDNKEITFSTTNGNFKGSDGDKPMEFAITSSNKEAETIIITGTDVDENVIIYASVGDFTNSYSIQFERAYPEQMTIKANKLSIKTDGNDESTISIDLYREIGTPSDNTLINLKAIELDSAQVSILPFIYSTENAASVGVKSKNGYPGQVEIVATTDDGLGDVISASLILSIVSDSE